MQVEDVVHIRASGTPGERSHWGRRTFWLWGYYPSFGEHEYSSPPYDHKGRLFPVCLLCHGTKQGQVRFSHVPTGLLLEKFPFYESPNINRIVCNNYMWATLKRNKKRFGAGIIANMAVDFLSGRIIMVEPFRKELIALIDAYEKHEKD